MRNTATSTDLSYHLSRAVAVGRQNSARPENREAVLARLLLKRAAAHRAGLTELEAILKRQIQWALPIQTEDQQAA